METGCVVIAGVGPGLGAAIARRFAAGGLRVAMGARRPEHLQALSADIASTGGVARAYRCDVTVEQDVVELFDSAEQDLGDLRAAIFNAGAFAPGGIADIEAADFERCWRVGCLGGFHVGREAARRLVPRREGTILFTGATASLRGSARFANLAVPKFGLRALAQSMARELGPEGIHVGHVIIDGQILSERHADLARERPEDGLLAPDAIAESYWHLHRQPRSAWTHELDLRPWVERF